MSTILENLNDQQFDAMKQFRKNVSDILPPDYPDFYILRWLKAHNFNLEKTESLFRSAMCCLELYLPNTHPDNFVKPEVFQKYEISCSIGRAKDGTPIRYTSFGTGDLLGFLNSVSGYDVTFYNTYLIQYDKALIKQYREETGKDVYEITYVVDLDGFSVSHILHKSIAETAVDLLQAMQDFYPEVFGNIFLVNVPSYFDVLFNVIKPILRLSMLQRIRVTSKESTPAMLLKYIDADVLPQFLGGKRTDSSGDPRCSEFIKFGGKIPEEYYLSNKKTLLMPTDPDVTSMWISARSVFNHSVVVRKPHSKIHVEYRSENGSIGFKMQFRGFGDNPDDIDLPASDVYLDESKPSHNVKYVSPLVRMQAHWSPIDVIITVPWPGIYIFRFDNTYGWFTSRRVIFRIRVEDD